MSRFLFLALILVGCAKDPIYKTATDNPEMAVSLLFTHDGCKVYRFYDSRRVYFSDCRGSVSHETQTHTNTGKTHTTTTHHHQTVNSGR
jgi:hypothetical protein